jgi:hypothetical protein
MVLFILYTIFNKSDKCILKQRLSVNAKYEFTAQKNKLCIENAISYALKTQ